MVAYVPAVVSPILRSATELKIEEFERATAKFKSRYLESVSPAGEDALIRLTALLEQIKTLDPYLEDDDDLENLTRYVEQAKNDRSISQVKLEKFEKQLLNKLDVHYRRLDVSFLHISLLREAMNSSKSLSSMSADLEKVALDDEFDMVEGELETAFEKFEKHTFKPIDVDADALESYLASLFEGDAGKRVLEKLREDVEDYGKDVIDGHDEIDEDTVEWCINDLLQNSLLSDDKRTELHGYLQSPASIRELTSLINVKSVRNWNWRNLEKGLPVAARQNKEGKYCITVEEDIVDMLFLHSLAVGWSMKVKECLSDAVEDRTWFPRNDMPTPEDTVKRDYYLLAPRPKPRPMPQPKSTVCTLCHGPPPPPPMHRGPSGPPPPPMYGGPPPPPPVWRSKSKKQQLYRGPPPPPPPHFVFGGSLNEERYRDYTREFFLSRLPKRYGSTPKAILADDTQASLMKYLAAEAKLHEAVDGEVHGVAANFSSFASSMPHKTILAMLKFVGMPQQWLDVFTRFLEAPLNMGPVVRGTSDQILTRRCGIPAGHGMELFLGELVLFFLDLIVHRKTGGYLYRLRDKCYFVGKEQQCKKALVYMLQFSHITGLDIATTNTLVGDPIGFVKFGIQHGQPLTFSIDDKKVEAYARRVKKQLAASDTTLEWIRLWNSTIGTYASHLFGPLANVFGVPHLEAVTHAYNKMHTIIFESSNLTAHVTQLLAAHIDPSKSAHLLDPTVLEALIFLPTSYGGLGVKNPYTTLNLAHDLLKDPSEPVTTFISDERTFYKKASSVFATFSTETRAEKLEALNLPGHCGHASILNGRTPEEFMSFEEYTANREKISYPYLSPSQSPSAPFAYPPPAHDTTPPPSILNVYSTLLEEPRDHISSSDKICDGVRELAGKRGMKGWYALSGEERWAVQMYGDECFERYGGLEVWCEESVPGEVLRMVRGEVEDDRDDASSVSEV